MWGDIARLDDRELDRALRGLERRIRLATAARDLDQARELLRVHCLADRECSRRFGLWLGRHRARPSAPGDRARRDRPTSSRLVSVPAPT